MRRYLVDHHEPCLCHPDHLNHVVRRPVAATTRSGLRVLTLNVRHGRGTGRRPKTWQAERFRENVHRIAEFLRATPADVVALQEADGPSFWSGSHHHVEHYLHIGEFDEFAHGLHLTFCRPRFGLSYGTALLSRVPLLSVSSRAFGARPLDPKGFVIATVSFDGREVDVASVHLDVVAPVRRRQLATLIRLLRRRPRPLILMGDLNSTGRRDRSAVRRIAQDLRLDIHDGRGAAPTYPSWQPSLRLDWILTSPELALVECRTYEEPVSDHLAVGATLTWR
jgi:endonuclease/exonuclease/phosphatase family metal-dependent hydrolase